MTGELDRLGDHLLAVRRRQARAERTPVNSSPMPIFDAIAATGQPIDPQVDTPVLCGQVLLDTEECRTPLDANDTTSALTDRMVCRSAGVYELQGAVNFGTTAGGWRRAWWRKNGADVLGSEVRVAAIASGSSNICVATPTRSVQLLAGDWVQLIARHNSSITLAAPPLEAARCGMYVRKIRNVSGE